ncbi:unnamed protein product [Zymoseptoria tritici ST99CH_1A5]|uniref:Probable glucan endo-1,3-beta-glucosidase eglC n=3 Tax=Zymoseptoria tritici TaxID=1047171 RepID=A0A1X7RN45_ZYMT9|nr:unnamed protein product [Zymoseptoria tritici ST99CH_3D7]SMR48682.1 unnamed protein product [Zymoseptoria tritici ST99CH_1E4]SMR49866.1 unnamed protein product [Zymoseptoria tritici ST99CH_3D1]SMY22563.1 unnamed protein product [Zymoseptoria tritici ST99CH_1A5]
MRFSAVITALAASAPLTTAFYRGFNMAGNNEDGSCKTTAQWTEAFNKLKGLPQPITSVRLFASSDCNTLDNAVPAALNTGTKLLVGLWTQNEDHFTAEKHALESNIKAHGSDWILACAAGSEDIYRGGLDINRLAEQIYDVRGMIRALGSNAPVGHVDTWNAWVNPGTDVVTKACDFVGMDAYPYWQGARIEDAHDVFMKTLKDTRDHVNSVKNGIPVWVTETGWPVSGPNFGASVASKTNAQKFWRGTGCKLFNQVDVFWYSYQDYNASPSFGIFDKNGKANYDLSPC